MYEEKCKDYGMHCYYCKVSPGAKYITLNIDGTHTVLDHEPEPGEYPNDVRVFKACSLLVNSIDFSVRWWVNLGMKEIWYGD